MLCFSPLLVYNFSPSRYNGRSIANTQRSWVKHCRNEVKRLHVIGKEKTKAKDREAQTKKA